MATIYKCDKCHSESIDNERMKMVAIPDESHSAGRRVYDLCPRCISNLKDWLKPDAMEGKQP